MTDNAHGKERNYDEASRLISTTSLSGCITYANQDFIDISGYSREELVGQPHNIVRHPDMPAAAFADLWTNLNADKPWLGAVKNRCKNGDYYWVLAYVTPQYDHHGKKTGYQSVRGRLPDEIKRQAQALYDTVNKSPKRLSLSRTHLSHRVLATVVSGLLAVTLVGVSPLDTPVRLLLSGLLTSAFTALAYWQLTPLKNSLNQALKIYDNPLSQRAIAGRMDEVGAFNLAIRLLEARIHTVTGRVEDAIKTLREVMAVTHQSLSQTTVGIEQQNLESDMLASASTEMASSSHNVAENTSRTSDVTHQAAMDAQNGRTTINDMLQTIELLSGEVEQASELSEQLHQQTEEIGHITTMINDIANQTNLLALNAAIEAARAGDNGRGFAVVADEVRELAKRTQQATEQIKSSIGSVQKQVRNTADSMSKTHGQAKDSISRAEIAGQAFDQLSQSLDLISDQSQQIAVAADEQNETAESLSKSIISIRDISDSNKESINNTNQAIVNLDGLVADLSQIVNRTKQ
ncbi:MAG: methyl-accepting chemotaxis protein [Oceanospirillales bacterium]|nr:methyl-accepting chemotaxis protein [Oceanospirillales bacterium]MBR9889784.1 methyl-accepting chemotaxis protein [Oceanospirillales bacterium]